MNATLIRNKGDARELMAPNPVSLDEHISLQGAAAAMTSMKVSAAPVINAAGRPLGVVSQSDILRHASQGRHALGEAAGCGAGSPQSTSSRVGLHSRVATVKEVMTPRVFAVEARSSFKDVVQEMLLRNVHNLFVVDEQGVLIGVITTLDLLRHLLK